MKKSLPPLNWLRSFDVSARCLNFTSASKELCLTQAAISQQIKGLESQLGVKLFKRLPRGLELTEAGQAYIPVVHESIQKLAAATEEMFGNTHSKLLNIKTSLVFFTTWLAPRLYKFTERYPDIKLRISSNIWVQYNDAAFDSIADIEIRYGQGNWTGLVSDRLTWDKLVPVCNPKQVNNLPLPTSPSQFDDYTLLHVAGYEEGWGYWLKKTGYPNVDASSGIQFDTLISALEMATLGQGIAMGRSSLIVDMLTAGKLSMPFDAAIETSEAFYLTIASERYRHPNIDIFRSWILEESMASKLHCEKTFN